MFKTAENLRQTADSVRAAADGFKQAAASAHSTNEAIQTIVAAVTQALNDIRPVFNKMVDNNLIKSDAATLSAVIRPIKDLSGLEDGDVKAAVKAKVIALIESI